MMFNRQRMSIAASLAAAAFVTAALIGCEEPGAEPYVAEPAPAEESSASERDRTRTGTGGQSALGRSKQAAENIVDQSDRRQQEMLEQIEDMND